MRRGLATRKILTCGLRYMVPIRRAASPLPCLCDLVLFFFSVDSFWGSLFSSNFDCVSLTKIWPARTHVLSATRCSRGSLNSHLAHFFAPPSLPVAPHRSGSFRFHPVTVFLHFVCCTCNVLLTAQPVAKRETETAGMKCRCCEYHCSHVRLSSWKGSKSSIQEKRKTLWFDSCFPFL